MKQAEANRPPRHTALYVVARDGEREAHYHNPAVMTEIEQLKHEVESLKKQLEESQRISRVYLQNVAHQLTAPLGAIKWSIEG